MPVATGFVAGHTAMAGTGVGDATAGGEGGRRPRVRWFRRAVAAAAVGGAGKVHGDDEDGGAGGNGW